MLQAIVQSGSHRLAVAGAIAGVGSIRSSPVGLSEHHARQMLTILPARARILAVTRCDRLNRCLQHREDTSFLLRQTRTHLRNPDRIAWVTPSGPPPPDGFTLSGVIGTTGRDLPLDQALWDCGPRRSRRGFGERS
jgi:hypothetical protein